MIDLQQEIFEHIPTLLQIAQVSSQIENENISFKEECKIESENYEKYSNNEFESNIDIDIKDSDCSLIDKFSCDTCDESFDTKFKLRKHKKIHQSKIKKSFKSNGTQLKQEKFIKDMQCSECDVYLPSKQSWQNHIKTHSDNLDNYNITSYSDDNSNKDSPLKEDFDSKMQIENNAQKTECNEEKNPHLCINCGKDFTTKKCLNLHKKKKICVKTESISCEICGKSFSHEGHLAVHSKIHVVDSNGINCKLCGKFVTDVEGHKMECRGEKFMCSECGNSYANKSSLRNHMKKHQATETGKIYIYLLVYLLTLFHFYSDLSFYLYY